MRLHLPTTSKWQLQDIELEFYIAILVTAENLK